ncbi:MAG: DUF3782 domain-containing protein [Acidobacteria bacterium]|nr:DUF3782 domain-containing protein [Acidobacteriota bacterium]
MTDQELRDFIAEVNRGINNLRISQQETDRQIKQVNKQLGELGNKFGSFTEGLAWPSMEKALYEQFGMNDVGFRRKAHHNGESIEVDVLAYDNTGARNEVYLVEIKSQLTQEGIDQFLRTISDFPRFFSDLKDRKIYGIIAAVDISDKMQKEVWKQGLYLARISDDTFKLQAPPDFKPKAFGRNGEAEVNGQKKNGATPARKRGKKARKGSR